MTANGHKLTVDDSQCFLLKSPKADIQRLSSLDFAKRQRCKIPVQRIVMSEHFLGSPTDVYYYQHSQLYMQKLNVSL